MSTPKNPIADFAPKLVEITDKVLFGDVWERPQLSKRPEPHRLYYARCEGAAGLHARTPGAVSSASTGRPSRRTATAFRTRS